MKKYFEVLQKTPLFANISADELSRLLQCLNAVVADYPKGGIIFLAGGVASRVGIVCAGNVHVVREDVFGNRAILAKLAEGELFGEALACAKVDVMPVSVTAATDCAVLLMDYRRIVATCPSSCAFHGKLIENMLSVVAQKNLMLNRKIEVLAARSTRDKLLVYLSDQAALAGDPRFEIPFNRQELADYLSVDRSAMSAELGRMRDEGLIRFHKNHFELL